MKKLLSAILAATMLLSLAGCSGSENTSATSGGETSTSATDNISAADSSSSADAGSTAPTDTELPILSNPVKMTEEGDIDMTVALQYETDFDALIESFNAKEIDPSKPVSENSNEATLGVFNYLRSIYGKQMISAQQMMGNQCYEDIVYYNATGDLPAMKGYDFIFCVGSAIDDSMVDEAIEWYKESGGLACFTWHWNVPRDIDKPDNGTAFYQEDITNFSALNAVTPGTKEYEQVIHDIDVVASKIQRMESEGMTIIFRPLHEASGKWFWWGMMDKDYVNNEIFQKLWYMIYDRMENYHKLTNIIWAWNGQSTFCAIHPNSYDIVGIDYYANSEDHTACVAQYENTQSFNEACYTKYLGDDYVLDEEPYEGKMLALTECGYIPDPQQCADTGCMWLYYMIWNGDFVYESSGGGAPITSIDGTPKPNTERMTNEMLVEYFGNDVMITYRDLPAEYLEGKDIPQGIKTWEYFKMD